MLCPVPENINVTFGDEQEVFEMLIQFILAHATMLTVQEFLDDVVEGVSRLRPFRSFPVLGKNRLDLVVVFPLPLENFVVHNSGCW